MKKRGLAVFALAAVLTLGTATLSSMAADGWAQSNGNWVYYNSSGSTVSNEWRKGADNLWRYLNSSGQMAVNSWVESIYYVDSNGILVTDKWMKLENPRWDRVSSDDQYVWYYFGSSGKVITDCWKKIDNKWYFFDDDGIMQTGWADENMYYCGSDGSMRTGWQKLAPPEGQEEENNRDSGPTMDGYEYDGKDWYYFGTNGKKYVPDDLGSAEFGERKIDGVYYCFDEFGAMQVGWRNIKSSDDDSAELKDYKYFGSDGKVKTGWLSLEPPQKLASRYDHSVEWFYFSSQGVPETGEKEGEGKTSDFVRINGKTYLFNDRGNPVYGLQKVYNSSNDYTSYYFGTWEQSCMQRGKIRINEGGETSDFYFTDSGKGYNGVRDGYLYYMGKLQKAESGTKYQAISIPNSNGYTTYVVNTSGKISKNSTVKTSDGVKYKTNGSGILTEVDGDAADKKDEYREPFEPEWENY